MCWLVYMGSDNIPGLLVNISCLQVACERRPALVSSLGCNTHPLSQSMLLECRQKGGGEVRNVPMLADKNDAAGPLTDL